MCRGIFWQSPEQLAGRVCVFQRRFEGIEKLDPATPDLSRFVDLLDGRIDEEAAALRRRLQDEMLPVAMDGLPCRTVFAPLKWVPGGLDPSDPGHAAYLRGLLDGCCGALLDSLDGAQDRLAVEPDPLVDECRLHLNFARARSLLFVPTPPAAAALARIERFIENGGSGALVVNGRSGSGKTYVMARAAVQCAEAGRGAVVVRFLGTSPAASTALGLLGSVCGQLQAVSAGAGRDTAGALPACPTGFDELSRYLGDALRGWRWGRVTVFLDSLDQLDDSHGGRRLDWLPLDGLAAEVRLVLSTLPDQPSPQVGRPFFCLSILNRRILRQVEAQGVSNALRSREESKEAQGVSNAATAVAVAVPTDASRADAGGGGPESAESAAAAAAAALAAETFVEVAPLTDAGELLAHLMRRHRRRLTPAQTAWLMAAVGQPDGDSSPLYLTLLASQAAQWRSFTDPPEIPATVRLVIVAFFRRLELASGERLVATAASYITLARQGLAETELQELLSLDDAVLSDVYQWCVTRRVGIWRRRARCRARLPLCASF